MADKRIDKIFFSLENQVELEKNEYYRRRQYVMEKLTKLYDNKFTPGAVLKSIPTIYKKVLIMSEMKRIIERELLKKHDR